MDGAEAPYLNPAASRQYLNAKAPASRRARRWARKGLGVSPPGAAAGADLGEISQNETL